MPHAKIDGKRLPREEAATGISDVLVIDKGVLEQGGHIGGIGRETERGRKAIQRWIVMDCACDEARDPDFLFVAEIERALVGRCRRGNGVVDRT